MKDFVLKQLGTRIRERRKAHGWTQEELAGKADGREISAKVKQLLG